MTTLTYCAIGTAPQYRINLNTIDPKNADTFADMLISTSDGQPGAAEAAKDARNPLATKIRQQLLDQMEMTESDLGRMPDATRNSFEQKMQTVVHEQILASGTSSGAYLDTQA